MIALHDTAGSSNPLGVPVYYDRMPMAPYFLFKDLITIFIFIFVLGIFVFFMPNVLGDSDNYIIRKASYCQNELLSTRNHQNAVKP